MCAVVSVRASHCHSGSSGNNARVTHLSEALIDWIGSTTKCHFVAAGQSLKELHVPLDLAKFVPLDVLHAPTPDSPRYRCSRCERMLSLPCFFTRSVELSPDGEVSECLDGQGRMQQRMPLCRLCVLIARRNASDGMWLGDWVYLNVM